MSTPTETLAIMLQRAKTHMETTGLSAEFNATYRELSRTLFDFEVATGVDPAALRDAEDENAGGDKTTDWECPECGDEGWTNADTLATVGTPYCADCDRKMVRTDD